MPRLIETALNGYELLNDPLLNKGTAFTDAERDEFDLHGLLPPYITALDMQVERRLAAFRDLGSDLQKYIFLRGSQDTNETLFYALLTRHIEEMMPIVYTPTVGLGCQQFSRIFRKPRGLFLSYPLKDHISRILSNPRFDRVDAIVVSDGERILGLGDQGAGGMGIPIGKLSLYTACAGLHPSTTLPILLDVGTDNHALLDDPMYIGWRHERMRDAAYDDFVDAFVSAVRTRWPHVLLHWEDFAFRNANRLLGRYRDRLCSFNDDIQGTAAIAVGTILSAINVTGVPLTAQRIAVLGAGSAGTGISALLLRAMIEAGMTDTEARTRFWLVDRDGLLVEGMPGLQPFQTPFAQSRDRIAGWKLATPGRVELTDVIAHRASDGADRHFRSGPLVHRTGGADDGGPRGAAGDLSALQSDRTKRGHAGRTSGLDARPRGDRHRQSVSAGCARRPLCPDRPDQQCVCLSGHRPRRYRDAGAIHFRRDVSRRRPHHRRPVSREIRSACQSAAAAAARSGRSRSRWRPPSPGRPKPKGSPIPPHAAISQLRLNSLMWEPGLCDLPQAAGGQALKRTAASRNGKSRRTPSGCHCSKWPLPGDQRRCSAAAARESAAIAACRGRLPDTARCPAVAPDNPAPCGRRTDFDTLKKQITGSDLPYGRRNGQQREEKNGGTNSHDARGQPAPSGKAA